MSDLFYLRDSRSNTGSNAVFWRDGGGYTSSLKDAELFSKESAQKHFNDRSTDWPLCKEKVDRLTEIHVDHQYLNKRGEIDLNDEYVIRLGDHYNGNDVYFYTGANTQSSDDYSKAFVFDRESGVDYVLKNGGKIYPKSHTDKICRPVISARNINVKSMTQGAGIKQPKDVSLRRRRKGSSGKTRWNCPSCGKINWQYNPYDFAGCSDIMCEEWSSYEGEY